MGYHCLEIWCASFSFLVSEHSKREACNEARGVLNKQEVLHSTFRAYTSLNFFFSCNRSCYHLNNSSWGLRTCHVQYTERGQDASKNSTYTVLMLSHTVWGGKSQTSGRYWHGGMLLGHAKASISNVKCRLALPKPQKCGSPWLHPVQGLSSLASAQTHSLKNSFMNSALAVHL